MSTTTEPINAALTALGFSMTSEYVPIVAGIDWRNPPMLKYNVVLSYRGREVYNGEYSLGIGHIYGYRRTGSGVSLHDEKFLIDLLTKKIISPWPRNPFTRPSPELVSVVSSIFSDGDAVDYESFEDWANNYGYDPDSRKAEAIYKACLATGLKLRNRVPASVQEQVRELLKEY